MGGGTWVTTRFDYYEQHLSIRGYNYEIKEVVSLGLGPVKDTGLYIFPSSVLTETSSVYTDYPGSVFSYSTLPIQRGYVHLLRLDSIKGSIQGIFELDLYSEDFKDTVHITEGRFFMNK